VPIACGAAAVCMVCFITASPSIVNVSPYDEASARRIQSPQRGWSAHRYKPGRQ